MKHSITQDHVDAAKQLAKDIRFSEVTDVAFLSLSEKFNHLPDSTMDVVWEESDEDHYHAYDEWYWSCKVGLSQLGELLDEQNTQDMLDAQKGASYARRR